MTITETITDKNEIIEKLKNTQNIKFSFPENGKDNMTLYYLLHDILPACNYVEITDGGWRTGFTYIDYEDLFIGSLSPRMKDRYVKYVILHENKDFTKPIYTVELY